MQAFFFVCLCLGLGMSMPAETDLENEEESEVDIMNEPMVQHSLLDRGGKVHLEWASKEKYVIFLVEAESKGYVGIGFSPNGGMKNSDIVVCYFDEDSKPRLLDMFAESESLPTLDASQDYVLISASKNDTHQRYKFVRNKKNCDDKDRNLQEETNHFIWALSDDLPYEEDGKFYFNYHDDKRGQQSLYLETSNVFEPPTSPDIKTWIVETPELTFANGSDTRYYCNLYQFPELDEKQHIIGLKVEPKPEYFPYLHHTILYQCFFGDKVDGRKFRDHPGAPCYERGFPREWAMCRYALLVWSIGTNGFYYKDKFGFPMEAGQRTFFMLEAHFDNSRNDPDAKGKAVIDVYYTSKLRQYDGGVLGVGHGVSPFQVIPPGQKDWASRSYCIPKCYEDLAFPEEGINLVSVLHHTHYLGRRLEAKVFRNGKEVDILSKDNQYDFEYQGKIDFPEGKKIYKGDTIVGTCYYDSSNRTETTIGGLRSRQEMCLFYYTYYPRIELDTCLSIPSWKVIEDIYNVKFSSKLGFEMPSLHARHYQIGEGPESGMSLMEFLRSERALKKENVEKLQKGFLNGDIYYFCTSDNNGTFKRVYDLTTPPKLEFKKSTQTECD